MFKLTSRPPEGHGRAQCDYYDTAAEMGQALKEIAENLHVLFDGESITIERIPDPEAVK